MILFGIIQLDLVPSLHDLQMALINQYGLGQLLQEVESGCPRSDQHVTREHGSMTIPLTQKLHAWYMYTHFYIPLTTKWPECKYTTHGVSGYINHSIMTLLFTLDHR